MLNELFTLSRSLESNGISTFDWHENYPANSKKQTILVHLDKNGAATNFSFAEDPKSKFRFYQATAGISFPSFNIYSPDALNTDSKVDKCFKLATEIEAKLGDIPKEYKAFKQLLDRSKLVDKNQLQRSLEKWLQSQIALGGMTKKICEKILNPIIKGQRGTVLMFVLEEDDSMTIPSWHEKTILWINSKLLENKPVVLEKNDIFGLNAAGFDEPFPKIAIPTIGMIMLRCQNHVIPAHSRYGVSGSQACVVGSESRKKIKSALEWITDNKRQNKTWTRIDVGSEKNNGILICYPSNIPNTDSLFASLFSGSQEMTFTVIGQQVIDTFKSLKDYNSTGNINIFGLAKVGKQSTKVFFSKSYTIDSFIESTNSWIRASKNHPTSGLRVPKDLAANDKTPIFPDKLTTFINKSWRQDGKMNKLFVANNGDCIKLFLESDIGIAKKFLASLVRGTSHIIKNISSINEKEFLEHVSFLPNVLGLLLYKMNHLKEDYMESPEFLLGQCCRLYDIIHKQYCKAKDCNPANYFGSTVVKIALRNPHKALAYFAQRNYILGWARARGNDDGLARWAERQLSIITSKLHKVLIPGKMITSDIEKATLQLGFMSRIDQTVETETN